MRMRRLPPGHEPRKTVAGDGMRLAVFAGVTFYYADGAKPKPKPKAGRPK